ncbi:glycosyl transferase family 64 domain-containing protein [Parasitella parasitica]|nr:glycosyl transferase family 64 domain-containing protein [Parasitella parasitica]
MVVNKIDELFEYPQFTAAVDIGGVLNTGVFVAEPDAETYKDIMATYESAPSYNKGDQGFLNYYFNKTANPLPGNYNLMVKFTHFSTLASGFVTKNSVKVLHFTSETKPWNFHFLHQREWRENYDGYLFGLWARSLRQMRAQLTQGGLLTSTMDWDNKGRVANLCDHRLKSNYGRKYPKKNQFTVILTLNKASINKQYLEQMLRMYASSKKVHQIFINGNSIKDEHGKRFSLNQAYLRSLKLRKPAKAIARGSFSTVNWKFNPIQGITTESVFLADENIVTSLGDLEFAFDVWRKSEDSIVGFTSDAHSLQTATTSYSFVENLDTDNRYSMISNSMFLKSDFLYGYTCILPEEIHQYIDKYPACLDIAINMLVSGQTGSSPILVKADYLFEFQHDHSQTTHQRSQCINELSVLFNGKNPLNLNNEIVSKASPEQASLPASWDSWATSISAIKARA